MNPVSLCQQVWKLNSVFANRTVSVLYTIIIVSLCCIKKLLWYCHYATMFLTGQLVLSLSELKWSARHRCCCCYHYHIFIIIRLVIPRNWNTHPFVITVSSLMAIAVIQRFLEYLRLNTLCQKRNHLDAMSLTFALVLNIILLLDAHHLLMQGLWYT